MEFSTEVVKKMAEIMVNEMERVGMEQGGIRVVENGMRELLRTVGAEALGRYVERVDEANKEWAVPCACGGQLEYQCKRKAVVISVFGRVSYERRYHRCRECHQGLSPVDRRMGLEAGEVTAGLAELLALAGVEVAFEESADWLERFLLFRVSDNTIRHETELFGQLQAATEAQWKKQSQDEGWLQERLHRSGKQAGRLYGSLDGVMAPLKGEWRELKTMTWYRVEAVRSYQKHRHHAHQVGEQNDLQAQDITYHCDMQTPEQLGELFWATACQRLADLHEELVFVCDGAVWIWKLIERYFPHAIQIVDWYHASAYLPPIAEAAFGFDTPQYHAWLDQARTLLWEGQIDALLHDYQCLASVPAAVQPVSQAISYFTNNQKRMNYAHFRAKGYFIGSGTVESAGKQIVGLRLKRAGARWTEPGAIATAKARAAWLSRSWDNLVARRAALPLAS